MDPVVLLLKEDILPDGKSKANKIWKKAYRFWLSKDQKLYKRSFSGPYLLCIQPEASELLLEELHKEFVEATWEADLCLTEPSHKAISGQTCKKKDNSI